LAHQPVYHEARRTNPNISVLHVFFGRGLVVAVLACLSFLSLVEVDAVRAQTDKDLLYEKPPPIIDMEKPPEHEKDSDDLSSESEESTQPRLVASFTFGGPLRLARNVDFGQERLGPLFVDLLGYLAYFDFHPDVFCLGHLSLPFQVLEKPESWGIETAIGIGYKLTAGAGVYLESSLDFFFGFDWTVHPLLSLEIGFFFDHEILP
jgi:hypothetical protein